MRRLEVVVDPRGCWAEVKGYRARDLLLEVGSRPVYSTTRRAWSVSARRGRDVAALAEYRGYSVTMRTASDAG